MIKSPRPFEVEYRANSVFTSPHCDANAPAAECGPQIETDPDVLTFVNVVRDDLEKAMRHFCLSEGAERIAADKEIAENRRIFGIR
jgi:hypothetical protein